MAYLAITDFKFGMDRRRKRISGVPGTLWLGKNCHLTRGGDVQSVKKFEEAYDLSGLNTFGLTSVNGQLYTFGSGAAPVGLPVGIQYQRLQAASASDMVELMDVKTFDGKIYAIARFANGHVHHFYDGTRVSEWDSIADAAASFSSLVDYMAELLNSSADVSALASGNVLTITSTTPGTAFTISKSTTDGGGTNDQDITLATLQANVAEVDEDRASATVTIASGTSSPGVNRINQIVVNGVISLIASPVDWTSSNAATATALAARINSSTATHGYSAVAAGAVVTITAAPGTGATPNGFAVFADTGGNVTATTTLFAGGVSAVEARAQVVTATFSGTFQAADLFTLTVNGVAYSATGRASATGQSLLVSKKRMWSPAGSLWRGSKLNDPTDWTDTDASIGAVLLNVSSESEGTTRIIGAAPYNDLVAVFTRTSIQLYRLNEDAEQIALVQPLDNTGALAHRALLPYGNSDVFYVDQSGIRSIRSRASDSAPYSDDVGMMIDPFVQEHFDAVAPGVIRRAIGVVEPRDGRVWIVIGSRVFVLSKFPLSKITAWTYYDLDFDITDVARTDRRLYVRGDDDIVRLYGGANGMTYPDEDEIEVSVKLPFLTAQAPATIKKLKGFDVGLTGEWAIKVLQDPTNESKFVSVGKFYEASYARPYIPLNGITTHAAIEFVSTKGGEATLSSVTLHYDAVETK